MKKSIEFEVLYNLVCKITLAPHNPTRLLEKGLVERLHDVLHECIAVNGWDLDVLTFKTSNCS